MSKAQDFVTSFMTKLAGSDVTLTPALQNVFAKILAAQVVVDADTNVVTFKQAFPTLLKVLTFIATPADERPEATSSYTQDAIDTAAGIAATDNGLTLGGEAPVDPELPTDEPTEEPTDGPTDEPTEEPGIEGNTLELTTGADVIAPLAEGEEAVEGVLNTTENNDTIEGAIASRKSETTFTVDDTIDGGAGTDTFNLTMAKSFSGYKNEAGIKNVERLNLTHEGKSDLKFNLDKIEGLETIALHLGEKGIELENISSLDTDIEAHNLAKGSLKLGFKSGLATASSQDDALSLVLNNVGTDAVGEACSSGYKGAETVTLAAKNLTSLNTLNIDSIGAYNRFDVNSIGTDAITVKGSAGIQLGGVSAQLETFNASAATGKVNATLDNVKGQKLKAIDGGSNDDKISVSATGLATTVSLNGGEGDNTLTIDVDDNATIKPTMSNFQTLTVSGVVDSKKLTISGENVDGLEEVNYNLLGAGNELLLANLDNSELTLNLGNESKGTATYTGEGLLTINTDEGKANPVVCDVLQASEAKTSTAKVVASKADEVIFNVAAFSTFSGEITAAVADEVTLNVASGLKNAKSGAEGKEGTTFNGKLFANLASVVNINAQGLLGAAAEVTASAAEELNLKVKANKDDASALKLLADSADALTLDVTGDGKFTIESTSKLGKVATLEVTTSGDVEIAADLKNLDNGEFMGTGSFEAATVGSLVKDVTLDASELLGGFTVTLDAYAPETGSTAADSSADITGSEIGVNAIEVTGREKVTVIGGVQADEITVSVAVLKKANVELATAEVTGGLGVDTFEFTGTTAETKLLATITDFEVGVDVLTDAVATNETNIGTDSEAAVKTFLNGFDVATNATEGDITLVKLALGGDPDTKVNGLAYDGDVYVLNSADADSTVLIKLAGLTDSSYDLVDASGFTNFFA